VPVLVAGAPAFTKLAAGGSGTCGLDATGAAWCWGGIVGSSTPVRVPGGHQFTEITVGGFVACGAATTGIWCWGNNEFGQLGNGRVVSWPQKIPVKVRFPQ
jgi:alpha-tubulin suppressor-like RCC1 family protein